MLFLLDYPIFLTLSPSLLQQWFSTQLVSLHIKSSFRGSSRDLTSVPSITALVLTSVSYITALLSAASQADLVQQRVELEKGVVGVCIGKYLGLREKERWI